MYIHIYVCIYTYTYFCPGMKCIYVSIKFNAIFFGGYFSPNFGIVCI